jgi:hypothetical protein
MKIKTIINETRTISNGPRPYVFNVYSVYEGQRRIGTFQTRKDAQDRINRKN